MNVAFWSDYSRLCAQWPSWATQHWKVKGGQHWCVLQCWDENVFCQRWKYSACMSKYILFKRALVSRNQNRAACLSFLLSFSCAWTRRHSASLCLCLQSALADIRFIWVDIPCSYWTTQPHQMNRNTGIHHTPPGMWHSWFIFFEHHFVCNFQHPCITLWHLSPELGFKKSWSEKQAWVLFVALTNCVLVAAAAHVFPLIVDLQHTYASASNCWNRCIFFIRNKVPLLCS